MRTPITLKIKFKSGSLDQFIERYSVDISRGGIFIRTKEPLAVGTPLKFEFQLQDASSLIGGDGTVVWTRDPDPARAGLAPGMGVRFDKLTGPSQATLEKILSEKTRRGEGLTESRYDAGVRNSQSTSGTIEDRDAKTPLPRPMPGLSDDANNPFPEESTRVMRADEARKLADRTRLDDAAAQAASFDGEQTVQMDARAVKSLLANTRSDAPPTASETARAAAGGAGPSQFVDRTVVEAKPQAPQFVDRTVVEEAPRIEEARRPARPEPAQFTGERTIPAQQMAGIEPAPPSHFVDRTIVDQTAPAALFTGEKTSVEPARQEKPQFVGERTAVETTRPDFGGGPPKSDDPKAKAQAFVAGLKADADEPRFEVPKVEVHVEERRDPTPPRVEVRSFVEEARPAPFADRPAPFEVADPAPDRSPLPLAPPPMERAVEPIRTLRVATPPAPRKEQSSGSLKYLIIGAAVLAAGGYFVVHKLMGSEETPPPQVNPTPPPVAVNPPVPTPPAPNPVVAPPEPTPPAPSPPVENPPPVVKEPPALAVTPPEKPAVATIPVEISTTPPGAEITVDGAPSGAAPVKVDVDPTKTHEIGATLKGYKLATSTLKVKPASKLALKLVPTEKFLEITTTPPGADIFLDGKKVGKSPASVKLPDLTKERKLQIKRPGFNTEERKIASTEPFETKGEKEVLTVDFILIAADKAAPAVPKVKEDKPKRPATEGGDKPREPTLAPDKPTEAAKPAEPEKLPVEKPAVEKPAEKPPVEKPPVEKPAEKPAEPTAPSGHKIPSWMKKAPPAGSDTPAPAPAPSP